MRDTLLNHHDIRTLRYNASDKNTEKLILLGHDGLERHELICIAVVLDGECNDHNASIAHRQKRRHRLCCDIFRTHKAIQKLAIRDMSTWKALDFDKVPNVSQVCIPSPNADALNNRKCQ